MIGSCVCPQEDLAEVQKLLKIEAMALDLSLASREKAQADLTKVLVIFRMG